MVVYVHKEDDDAYLQRGKLLDVDEQAVMGWCFRHWREVVCLRVLALGDEAEVVVHTELQHRAHLHQHRQQVMGLEAVNGIIGCSV